VTDLTSLETIREAARRVSGVALETPLLTVEFGGGRSLRLKCENLQPVGAFKIRGAFNMIAQLEPEARQRGVITFSSGNHGQAVAYAARRLGAPAVVVMPTTAPAVKVEGAKRLGAEVLFEGTTSADRKRRAEAEAASRGLTIVPPFEHPWIIAGQGTLGIEILAQDPAVRTVYVPVGGGGLISGIAAAVKRISSDIRVVGVEPIGSATMGASVAAGRVVQLDRTASIADGLLALAPGELTFAHVRALVDEMVVVEEEEIVDAMMALFRFARLVVEPSGAVGVAAALARRGAGPPGKEEAVAAVISGGNVSIETLATLAAGRASAAGPAAVSS
jgi:threonine dehydratase